MDAKPERKILIIDDEETLLKNIGDFFRASGYAVFTSPNSDSGLGLLKEHSPELLLLDLHLKEGLTGMQVLKEAKSLKPDLKVVILSGFGEDEDTRDVCVSLGADAFLGKPTSLKSLAGTIKNLLEVK
ncbi:MAG: response regulator [Candidatus Omnitrophota bacterium]|jgi:DNA-binding response OmpR family regulator